MDLEIENFEFQAKDPEKNLIFKALKEFFGEIKHSKSIDPTNHSVNIFLFEEIARLIAENKTQLINAFSSAPNEYHFKFSVTKKTELRAIFSIVASTIDGEITFSSPIGYRTKNWKNKQIGNVKYLYRDSFNKKTAENFNQANIEFANKFSVPVKELTYYKCANYEEVQRLIGIDFDSEKTGVVQSSEDFENTIITGVNSEDYSHDLFHMYIQTKFPDDNDRNFIAEEGYANSIANAYYAKNNGEIISRRELVFYLKEYLKKNPKTDLIELFEKNSTIYYQLSGQVSHEVLNLLSVKSTITSVICDEVERVKGFEGLIELLRSGKSSDDFFAKINDLVEINKSNFNEKVQNLISNFS